MLRPPLGGSVQVVSSTNGELGGDDRTERKSGVPLNAAPEVDVVEETKYVFSFKLLWNDMWTLFT